MCFFCGFFLGGGTCYSCLIEEDVAFASGGEEEKRKLFTDTILPSFGQLLEFFKRAYMKGEISQSVLASKHRRSNVLD